MFSNPAQNGSLIGVLDLLDGVVVRAVGGRRSEYRPVQSRIAGSADPRRVAEAFRDRYGITELYVADLDAIQGQGSNEQHYGGLLREGFRLTVDAGVCDGDDATRLISTGIDTVVAALESLRSPDVLDDVVRRLTPQRTAFSLDLAGGVPLADPQRWRQPRWTPDSALHVARLAAGAGIERLIVLDLHAVGGDNGPVTTALCRQLRAALPESILWSGGGVRSADDVRQLTDAGVQGVLVASALHDETL